MALRKPHDNTPDKFRKMDHNVLYLFQTSSRLDGGVCLTDECCFYAVARVIVCGVSSNFRESFPG